MLTMSSPALFALSMAAGLVLAGRTVWRNTVYRDTASFCRAAVRESPSSAPGHEGLADVYKDAGEHEKALAHYRKAIRKWCFRKEMPGISFVLSCTFRC